MSTWVVDEVIEKPGQTVATLHQTEWFKENPEYRQMMDEYEALIERVGQEEADREDHDTPWIEETVSALPGERGAEAIEGIGRLTLDITDGPELHPMDNVELHVSPLVTVEVSEP